MKNKEVSKMIEALEKRNEKIKGDLLKELKTDENLKIAERLFWASDKTWCGKDSNEYKNAIRQARRTTVECLNMLFMEEKIDFLTGDIPLYRKLENYIVNKDHIHVLKEDYEENETAILFSENIDIAQDISDTLIWIAEIEFGKIEYTLFEDKYSQLWSIETEKKPRKEIQEKVKTWYRENGFTFKED